MNIPPEPKPLQDVLEELSKEMPGSTAAGILTIYINKAINENTLDGHQFTISKLENMLWVIYSTLKSGFADNLKDSELNELDRLRRSNNFYAEVIKLLVLFDNKSLTSDLLEGFEENLKELEDSCEYILEKIAPGKYSEIFKEYKNK
jgi:hypothetical protein